MVNPMVGVASLGGMGAKTIADGMTRQNAQVLDALIRSGGSSAATPGISAIRQAIVDALTRGSAQSLAVSPSR